MLRLIVRNLPASWTCYWGCNQKSLNFCPAKYWFFWTQNCDEFWPRKSKNNGIKKIKIGEDTEDKVWFFMQWIWKTALITIFLHTHNDLGAATISGLMETADSILLFMLFLFHVTWKVPGEMYRWAQSYFQSSYKHFLDNEISMMLFLWFLGAQIIMDKIFIGFMDLLSEIN